MATRSGSGPRAGVSGRFLIPSVVRHLDQLSSIASISSRKKRGERFMRETTTPGHLAFLDLVVDAGERDR